MNVPIERMYTINDIAQLQNCSVTVIRRRLYKSKADKDKIQFHYTVDKTGAKHREMIFTASQLTEFNLIGTEKKYKKNKKKPKAEPVISIEELKAQHKLVTDNRFFKLSYFPDVSLVCFMELEEE